MSRYNACGMCKNGEYDEDLKSYKCSKKSYMIGRFVDTSDCKEFENKENPELLKAGDR